MPALTKVMARRWPWVLVLLLLMLLACFGVTRLVPPTYQAQASMVLMPPESPDSPDGNRYLLLGGLTPARDVVLRALSSQSVAASVTRGEPGTGFTIAQDYATSAPIVMITVDSPAEASAVVVLDRIVREVPSVLTSLQNELGTSHSARITSLLVAGDGHPHRVGKKQIRAVVAAAGLSLVAGLLLIRALDGVLLRRRQRMETPPSEGLGVSGDTETPGEVLGVSGDTETPSEVLGVSAGTQTPIPSSSETQSRSTAAPPRGPRCGGLGRRKDRNNHMGELRATAWLPCRSSGVGGAR